MLSATRAIVIRTTKFGDSKLFVETFCQQYGRTTFVCPVGNRSKGRGWVQYFQPLNIIELEMDYRQNLQMQKLREVRIATPLNDLSFNPHKLFVVMFLAEFMDRALRAEQQNEALYQYIERSILWLNECRGSFANFHIIFILGVLSHLGFAPYCDDYAAGAWFDMREGVFSHFIPRHDDKLTPQDSTLVPLLMRLNYRTMHLLRLSRQQRNSILENLVHYCQLHIPNFTQLRSLSVMQEVFS